MPIPSILRTVGSSHCLGLPTIFLYESNTLNCLAFSGYVSLFFKSCIFKDSLISEYLLKLGGSLL